MSNTPKLTSQELFFNLSNLLNGRVSAKTMFAGHEFRRHFKVYEVERGKYRILEQLPSQVMAYTTAEAVEVALLAYVTKLPEKEYAPYKFTANKAVQCVKFWLAQPESYFDAVKNKIHPVLELSQEGYCWQRTDFDAAEGPCPLWLSMLGHVVTDAKLVEAFIGATLDPSFARQYYLWIHGPGGDGKGSLMRVIRRIYGNAYMSLSSDLKHQNQFFTASLVGRRIAAFQDCHNPKLPLSELFMQLAGGDPIRIEEKGMPAYMTELDVIPVITSNYEPLITSSPAHMRRCVYAKFRSRTTWDGPKDTYEARLWGERAAILHRCKLAWQEVRNAHGGFPEQREVLEDLASAGESKWEALLHRYFVIDEDAKTLRCADFTNLLRERERLNDFEIAEFKRYLERLGVQRRRVAGTDRPRVMIGLKLKEQSAAQERRF